MSRTFKSTTGLSRRFLNLIAANHSPGVKSLHRIGLGRIFNSTPAPIPNGDRLESAAGQEDYMVRPRALDIIRLPTPVMSFRSSASFESKEWKLDCFPFSDCKVFCMDQSGRGFLFDANSCGVSTVAHLHTPKRCRRLLIFTWRTMQPRRYTSILFFSTLVLHVDVSFD